MPVTNVGFCHGIFSATTQYWYPIVGGIYGNFDSGAESKTLLNFDGMFLIGYSIAISQSTTSATLTVRSYNNGANGNITITVPAATTGTMRSAGGIDVLRDNTNLSLTCSTSGTGDFTFAGMAYFLHAGLVVRYILGTVGGSLLNGTATYYAAIAGGLGVPSYTSTLSNSAGDWKAYYTGPLASISDLAFQVTYNTSTSIAFTIQKNGADTALTASVGASATGRFRAKGISTSIINGDYLEHKIVITGAGTQALLQPFQFTYISPNAEWFPSSLYPYNIGEGSIIGVGLGGGPETLESSTLTHEIYEPVTFCNACVYVQTNTISGPTYISLGDGVTSGGVVTVPASTTGLIRGDTPLLWGTGGQGKRMYWELAGGFGGGGGVIALKYASIIGYHPNESMSTSISSRVTLNKAGLRMRYDSGSRLRI